MYVPTAALVTNLAVHFKKGREASLVWVTTLDQAEPVRDAELPVLVEGQPCYRLPVTLTAEGRYHELVQALERMTAEAFPSVVSLEHVDLQLKDPQGTVLTATVKLYLYVVSAPSAPAPDA